MLGLIIVDQQSTLRILRLPALAWCAQAAARLELPLTAARHDQICEAGFLYDDVH